MISIYLTPTRRPRRCGRCSMFGHDRRSCHLHRAPENHEMAIRNWRYHCDINAEWIAVGGAGHHVDEPQPPKTPFELACENKCDVIMTKECCICMEALGEKNTATTACGHQFHFGCLAQHTSTSNSCPMCRSVICPEMPKRELKLPSHQDLASYGLRAVRPMVRVMTELHVGTDMERELIGEATAMLITDSIGNIMTAVSRINR
jgi:hypothetical protein